MSQTSLWENSFFVVFSPNCLSAGATLACGTGACATVVAAVLEGRAGRVSACLLLILLVMKNSFFLKSFLNKILIIFFFNNYYYF